MRHGYHPALPGGVHLHARWALTPPVPEGGRAIARSARPDRDCPGTGRRRSAPGEGHERYREVRIPHSPGVSRFRCSFPSRGRPCQGDFPLPRRRPLLPLSPRVPLLFLPRWSCQRSRTVPLRPSGRSSTRPFRLGNSDDVAPSPSVAAPGVRRILRTQRASVAPWGTFPLVFGVPGVGRRPT